MNAFLVFVGGGLGSVLRFGIGYYMQKIQGSLPLATFLSNISACLLVVLAFYLSKHYQQLSQSLHLFLMIGFCGGLSTFSTFSYETWQLLANQNYLVAFGNIIFSVAIGLLSFYLFRINTN